MDSISLTRFIALESHSTQLCWVLMSGMYTVASLRDCFVIFGMNVPLKICSRPSDLRA